MLDLWIQFTLQLNCVLHKKKLQFMGSSSQLLCLGMPQPSGVGGGVQKV